jgi:arabinose-5-phosphate isomerase
MHTGESVPLVRESASMGEAIKEMTAKRLGITGIVDGEGVLIGAVTDGDLRRALEGGGDILAKMAVEVMSRGPKLIGEDLLAEAALKVMEEFSITAVFVTGRTAGEPPQGSSDGSNDGRDDGAGKVVGIIHLHDLLKAGVV